MTPGTDDKKRNAQRQEALASGNSPEATTATLLRTPTLLRRPLAHTRTPAPSTTFPLPAPLTTAKRIKSVPPYLPPVISTQASHTFSSAVAFQQPSLLTCVNVHHLLLATILRAASRHRCGQRGVFAPPIDAVTLGGVAPEKDRVRACSPTTPLYRIARMAALQRRLFPTET
ncbi:uncharacterized protein BDW70DRAFT_158926 [Aspergillus foveolatus]|uniref:uncharacterized protein n=1 Tax=Aspergillus foveolatus TaxID=210207 RepID=UPI003CCD3A9A